MQFMDKICDFADAAPDGEGRRQALEQQLMSEEYEAALREVEAQSARSQSSGDGPGRAAALQATATVKHVLGRLTEAKEVAEEALAAFRLFGGAKGEAIVLHTLARVGLDMEKLDEAKQAASDSRAKFQEVQCKEGEGAVLITTAKVCLAKGDLEGCLSAADDAMAIFKGASSEDGQAAVLTTRCMIRLAAGELAEATRLAEEVVALCATSPSLSAKHRHADALLLMASAALAQQLGQEGLEKARAALALSSGLGKRGKAMALQAIAGANLELWDLEGAAQAIGEAVSLDVGDKQVRASVLSTAARVYRARLWKDGGETPDLSSADVALKTAKDAVALYRELGSERSAGVETLELAQMHMECGNADEAMAQGVMAQEAFAKLGDQRGEAIALLTTSELYYNKGDVETALGNAKSAHRTFTDFGAEDLAHQASEVIKFLDARLKPAAKKKSNAAIPETVKEPENMLKNTAYSQIIRHRIATPDSNPLAFDQQGIMYMGFFLGINIPFLPDATGGQGAPPPPPKPRPSKGGGGGASDPPSSQLLEARRRQEARATEKAELEAEAKPLPPPPVSGSDILGGRARDVSEELHGKMLGLAVGGEIPTTTPDKRAYWMLRKPTFHGPAEWREAVAQGYLHPKMNAPRGLKWKSLTVGWKLVPQVARAPAEEMECSQVAAGAGARGEPLRGAPWLACQ